MTRNHRKTSFEDMTPTSLRMMPDADFDQQLRKALGHFYRHRQEQQIIDYKPLNERCARIHQSTAHWLGASGGNGSSKTETTLVEIISLATGVFPASIAETQRRKFRGPINVRIVVESLTNVLYPIILPKLIWNRWTGVDQPGGERGHWGWVPRTCLIDGQWDRSYTASTRMLRIYCYDPDSLTGEIDPVTGQEIMPRRIGESTVQFMCLRGDQMVRMAAGTWREIRTIKAGEWVSAPDNRPVQVSKVHRYDDAPLLRIRCKGGREVVATPNHLHVLNDGGLRRSDQLAVGEVLRCNRDISHTSAMVMPEWLLGWMAIGIGDGYLKGRDFSFTAMAPSRVLDDLPPLPPECKLVQMGSVKEWRIWRSGSSRNPLVRAMKEADLWGLGSADKFVPDEVFCQADISRAYFLRHLWNTDGTVNEKGRQAAYSTISKRLAYGVKYLLWGLGIYASVGDVKGRCGFTGKSIKAFHVVVSGGSFDRFRAALAGGDFLSLPISTKGQHGEIKAIEPVERDEVFCLEVDSDDHQFVVDGLATHNSHDNDPEEFASGDFHIIMLDEPPSYPIFTECQARTMRVDGRIILAMTWPDDPAAPVDWIYDEVYDKGTPGNAAYDPDFEWLELLTTENLMLDQEAVARQARNWDAAMRAVRLEGKPLRFSNLVHSTFTETPRWWCFTCKEIVGDQGLTACPMCGNDDLVKFCHVSDQYFNPSWPVIWCLDPHPRKPHFVAHVGIDPNDDLYWLHTMEVMGDADDVREATEDVQRELNISNVVRWIGDPRMLGSPTAKREVNWQDEFINAGIPVDKADPSDLGRERVNTYLKPDPYLRRPRMHWHPRCDTAISQFKRFAWDEYKGRLEKDQKQTARDKHDDYPAIARYIMNDFPTFEGLMSIRVPMRRPGTRRGAY